MTTRVTPAFKALNAAGIYARENFMCCGGCGHSAAHDHAPKGSRGYVFWHEQADENRRSGKGWYLYFGGLPEDEGDAVAVGKKVVQTLCEYYIDTKWDGSADTAIFVEGVPEDKEEYLENTNPYDEDEEEEE